MTCQFCGEQKKSDELVQVGEFEVCKRCEPLARKIMNEMFVKCFGGKGD